MDKDFHLTCGAGCHILKVTKMGGEDYSYLSFYTHDFYSKQESVFSRFRTRVTRAVAALRGDEYHLGEFEITREQQIALAEILV